MKEGIVSEMMNALKTGSEEEYAAFLKECEAITPSVKDKLVEDAVLKKAVEDAGYTVKGIQ